MKLGEIMEHNFSPGEIVYIILRNPHAQNVAQVQQAAVVAHPEKPNELALFAHDNYFPLTDEFAIFTSEHEAEAVYQEAFGTADVDGEFYG